MSNECPLQAATDKLLQTLLFRLGMTNVLGVPSSEMEQASTSSQSSQVSVGANGATVFGNNSRSHSRTGSPETTRSLKVDANVSEQKQEEKAYDYSNAR